MLEEIAKAFPNDFPRNVDKATVREISSRLEPQDAGSEDAPKGNYLKLAARPRAKLKTFATIAAPMNFKGLAHAKVCCKS